jgi:hypothetical protein
MEVIFLLSAERDLQEAYGFNNAAAVSDPVLMIIVP